jgi:hypothetical protein
VATLHAAGWFTVLWQGERSDAPFLLAQYLAVSADLVLRLAPAAEVQTRDAGAGQVLARSTPESLAEAFAGRLAALEPKPSWRGRRGA